MLCLPHSIQLHLHFIISLSPTLSTNTAHSFIAITSKTLQPSTILMEPNMPKPVKQLGQLLQEQQEPFCLKAYLQEKGYLKKGLNSKNSFGSCHGNSNHFLKKSTNKNRIHYCSKIIRAVINKLNSIHESPSKKHFNHKNGGFGVNEMEKSIQEVAELGRFSSASSTTVLISGSDSEVEDTFQALKVCRQSETDGKLKERSLEDSKQLSPVSVLEETPYDQGSLHSNALCSFILRKKVTDDNILSASLWELLVHLPAEKPNINQVAELQELVGLYFSTQHFKSRRVLQQRRQLLFDCIREVVDTHQRGRKQQHLIEFLGPEELGKIICEKLRYWGNQSGDEASITQLLHLDYLALAQEWSAFDPYTREIAMEIGDAILEDINDEIVTDMIDTFKECVMNRL